MNILDLGIKDNREDQIKETWRKNKERVKRGLLLQFWFEDADSDLKKFVEGDQRS